MNPSGYSGVDDPNKPKPPKKVRGTSKYQRPLGSQATEDVRCALASMRKLLGLSHQDVADKLVPPVTAGAIEEFERAVGELSIGRADRLATAMGLKLGFTLTVRDTDDGEDD